MSATLSFHRPQFHQLLRTFCIPADPIGRLTLRIVGGANTTIESYPHQVSVALRGGCHHCGGSIISSNYVITAAHCVDASIQQNELKIQAGSTVLGEGGSRHHVDKITRHKDYGMKSGVPINDIALVKVKEAFKLDSTRKPIGLYRKGEVAQVGDWAVASGWGVTKNGWSDVLQAVTVPVMAKSTCDDVYKESKGGLSEGQICAGYLAQGGKGVCDQDDGGPVTIDGRLAGIVSWYEGCGLAYKPGVFTEVAYFREWIDENAV